MSSLFNTFSDKRISDRTLDAFGVCRWDRGTFDRPVSTELSQRADPGRFPRLVFPLLDLYGQVTGVGYRSDNVKFLYDKGWDTKPSEMLYGLNVTHPHIAKSGYAIIVEGTFDFLRLYDVGVHSVVSTLGARLSWAQMCLLRRFCENVIICYDPDAAGRSATRAAADRLRQGGMRPFPVYLDLDPDDFVNKYGVERFFELCFQSLNNTGEALRLRL